MKLKNKKIKIAESKAEDKKTILLLYKFERRNEREFENRKMTIALNKIRRSNPKIPKVKGIKNQKK
jgi:hypothetical protein